MNKILIIEDDADIRETLTEILTMKGFQVFTAKNGEQGIAQALIKKPNIILCDIMMPGVSGYEVLETLRDTSFFGQCVFMFLTAKNQREDLRRGLNLGADDYIMKPFKTQELLNALNARLKRKASISTYASEEEQGRFARDLHDGLQQVLLSIKLYMTSLQDCVQQQPPEKQAVFQQIQSLLGQAIEESRLIARNSMPRVLQKEGLAAAIEFFLQQFSSDTIRFDFKHRLANLPNQIVSLNLYRIAQEAINNALKHANASQVKVRLYEMQQPYRVCLQVKDNGKGLNESQIKTKGLGLKNIRERSHNIGGKCRIERQPDRGTIVEVCVPI